MSLHVGEADGDAHLEVEDRQKASLQSRQHSAVQCGNGTGQYETEVRKIWDTHQRPALLLARAAAAPFAHRLPGCLADPARLQL